MVCAAHIKTANQFNGVLYVFPLLFLTGNFFHVDQKIRLKPLIQPSQRKSCVGVFHVHSDPHDPHCIDGFIKCDTGILRNAPADIGQTDQFIFAAGIRFLFREARGLNGKIFSIDIDSLKADLHRAQCIELLFFRLWRLSQFHVNLRDNAFGAKL